MRPLKIFLFFLFVVLLVSAYKHYDDYIEIDKIFETETDTEIIQPADSSFSEVYDTVATQSAVRLDSATIHKDVKVINDVLAVDSIKNEGVLFNNNLHEFYSALNNCNNYLLRVVYYGDSQIEGDHVTYTLRKGLQEKFGGAGIGFLPVQMYYNMTHNLAVVTNDFEKHAVKYADKTNEKYGLYGQYFELKGKKGSIRLVNRGADDSFRNIKILSSGFSVVQVLADKNIIASDTLTNADFEIGQYRFTQTPGEIRINFSNAANLRLYGIMLESEAGVVVDNVSFRGNLSLMAYRFGNELVQEMDKQLNADLLILHFGLNVIPDKRPNYESYRVAIERDINTLRQNMPSASVLLIGASDMAHKVNGELRSHDNIEEIIEAQIKAACNCGVAFWDMRQAMGGKGSIINWVEKEYARSDYAHLTLAGSNAVGEMLCNDLLTGWQNFNSNSEIADTSVLVYDAINAK
ncbi:MAG: hypothetical protein PF436_08065 [Prolixibacteraceae bacterium]|jgi:hypothetical protein|nr:hypothetical protein [Prolixibacteraceae bacterium]